MDVTAGTAGGGGGCGKLCANDASKRPVASRVRTSLLNFLSVDASVFTCARRFGEK
jgi:hypothetical protein